MNVVITANSPGEVASWLRPMVGAVLRHCPGARVHVCLAPCAYSTGAEAAVARSIPGVYAVHSPRATVSWAWGGRRPPEVEGDEGLILFLGGDLVYGALLSWRTRWPAAAYTEGRARWMRRYRRLFVPDAEARARAVAAGAPPERVMVTGDLMLDGLTLRWPAGEGRARLGLADEAPVVGLFPGSRRHELRYGFPLQLRAAAHIASRRPGVKFLAAISPFATREALTEALEREGLFTPPPEKLVASLFPEEAGGEAGYPWSPAVQVVEVEWLPREPGPEASRRGRPPAVTVKLVRGAPYDVAAASDVVMTMPGSNTAELGGLGTPMVVAIPLQHIEEIPLEGIPGLVGGLPFVGRKVKRWAIERLSRKVVFTAWPNRRAGRMIVPELRRYGLRPEDVADEVVALLDDPGARARMSAELRRVMGEPGAADRIARACLELVEPTAASSP